MRMRREGVMCHGRQCQLLLLSAPFLAGLPLPILVLVPLALIRVHGGCRELRNQLVAACVTAFEDVD